jgi:hypothetical protein
MEQEEMEMSMSRIKQIIEWFPGVTLGVARQIGKTEAIIQIIHEKHGGNAAVISPSEMLSEGIYRRYREAYPNDTTPLFTSDPMWLRGKESRPVYVDEPWFMSESKRQAIANLRWPVMARIGTSSW